MDSNKIVWIVIIVVLVAVGLAMLKEQGPQLSGGPGQAVGPDYIPVGSYSPSSYNPELLCKVTCNCEYGSISSEFKTCALQDPYSNGLPPPYSSANRQCYKLCVENNLGSPGTSEVSCEKTGNSCPHDPWK